jgi:hypothetical protein
MSQNSNDIFKNSTEEVVAKIRTTQDPQKLMNYICYINPTTANEPEGDNTIIMDYRYFKHIASPYSYQSITAQLLNMIDTVLSKYSKFNVKICIKSLTVSDIDKHYAYIKDLSNVLKTTYQDKMGYCHVYRAPFIFAQIFNIVSCFIDKETQTKIKLMDTPK